MGLIRKAQHRFSRRETILFFIHRYGGFSLPLVKQLEGTVKMLGKHKVSSTAHNEFVTLKGMLGFEEQFVFPPLRQFLTAIVQQREWKVKKKALIIKP